MLRRNGPVIKSVESVLRPEGSLQVVENFVKKVGLEPGVKEGVTGGESGELTECEGVRRRLPPSAKTW